MRQSFLAIAITLLLHSNALFAQNYKLDERNGFRDAKLGMLRSDLPGLVEKTAGPNDKLLKVYSRPTDKLEIGPFKLTSIEYVFYKDYLHSIRIWAHGLTSGNGIRDVLLEEYGPAQKLDYLGRPSAWLGTNVTMRYNINDFPTGYFVDVHILSNSLMRQVKLDNENAIKTATSDL